MRIFSNQQIKSIIDATISRGETSEYDLVAKGAEKIAEEICSRWESTKRTVIFAGWGGNGADALATARVLMRKGFHPEIILLNIGGNLLSPLCAQCRDLLLEEFPDVRLTEITSLFSMPDINAKCLVIDGLFGSGLTKAIPQSISMIVRNINESGADIVSIDIPSGLFDDWNTNSINNNIVHATLTLAIEFPRLSFFFDDNAELIGEWKPINVGYNRDVINHTPYSYYLITGRDVRRILRPRLPEATKNEYGSALICAGSYGMMGAAVLAARGCMRSGVGKLTCYSPRCGYEIMQTAVPSAMFIADPHQLSISEITLQRDYQAVGIGPGIGVSDITINALENFLKVANANRRPVVLDADALNCIALRPMILNYLPVMSVLTPHAGEFDRMFGQQPSDEARLRKAQELASYHSIVIVLKGRYTAVVRPDGRVYFNSSGCPALATAGSGDVLTGVITGLMAQGYNPETAAILGAYIHGTAGILCEEQHGYYGTTSEDIADNIGRAIKSIML